VGVVDSSHAAPTASPDKAPITISFHRRHRKYVALRGSSRVSGFPGERRPDPVNRGVDGSTVTFGVAPCGRYGEKTGLIGQNMNSGAASANGAPMPSCRGCNGRSIEPCGDIRAHEFKQHADPAAVVKMNETAKPAGEWSRQNSHCLSDLKSPIQPHEP
jgi:hypothetical protein